MRRVSWLILAGSLLFVATVTLIGAIIRGLVGEVAKYPIANIVATFVFILVLDYGAYWSWMQSRISKQERNVRGAENERDLHAEY